MELRDSPLISPGACVVCMGYTGPVFDSMVNIPGYGRIYICAQCVKDAFKVLPPEKKTLHIEPYVKALNRKVKEQNDSLDCIADIIANWRDSSDVNISDFIQAPVGEPEDNDGETAKPIGTKPKPASK